MLIKCICKQICGHLLISLESDRFCHGDKKAVIVRMTKSWSWPYGTMAKVQNCKWTPASRGQETLMVPLAWSTIIVPYGDLKDRLGVRKSCQKLKGSWVPIVALSSWENHRPKSQAPISSSPKSIRPPQTSHCTAAPAKERYFLPFLWVAAIGSPWRNSFNSTSLFCCSKWSQYFYIKIACLRKMDNVDDFFLVTSGGKLQLFYLQMGRSTKSRFCYLNESKCDDILSALKIN